jgi:hypothetical protein
MNYLLGRPAPVTERALLIVGHLSECVFVSLWRENRIIPETVRAARRQSDLTAALPDGFGSDLSVGASNSDNTHKLCGPVD